MNDELITAITRLGYRHMGKGCWGKPIAYHLCVVVSKDKEPPEWRNYFIGANKQMLIWQSRIVEPNGTEVKDYENYIKATEFASRYDVGQYLVTDFGFLTQEEYFKGVM
jgi:hypothetical protein